MSLLDPTPLANLLADIGGDRATLAAILAQFLEEAPANLATLRQSSAAGEAAEARRAAHSLKSTAAQMGAMRLSELCRDIEHAAAAGTLPTPQALDALDALWSDTRRELDEERRRYAV
ncbi:MAG: Hpt domain-containing protein [Candidatus Thermoplasmatota archaeon]